MATNEQTNTLRRLVMRVGKGSLMFTTTDDQSQVVFEQYPINSSITMAANLREALRTSNILTGTYQRTLVMVDTPVLMVPTDLFREEEKAELYFHTFTKKTQQTIMHTVLPDLNCVALFSIDKDLLAVINDRMNQASIVAAMTPVWRHLHQRSYTGTHHKLYGYFHNQRMEVFSFSKNRFKFCNTFGATYEHDALYYLLNTFTQLGFQASRDEFVIMGDTPHKKWIVENLKHYVSQVTLTDSPASGHDANHSYPYDLTLLSTQQIMP